MLHVWTSARYTFPLPAAHRFPISKYARLREEVLTRRIVPPQALHEPERASRDDLQLVHTADYVDRFLSGELSAQELRRLGFPWSSALVERSLRAVGGTCEAAAAALEHGVAMNLAGGTHHAFADHGEGFCVFNDVAIATRSLQRAGRVQRVAIVDLDVHQGNGTNAIFAGDEHVFTFSMHGGRNYPFHKVPGSLDIELNDGTGDEEYLAKLADALPGVLARSGPDLVVYLAGADAHEGDALGRLALTFEGLARRDAFVMDLCREVGLPIVITIAGGYGRNLEDTVRIHLETARIASAYTGSSVISSRA
ncbi:MAG TPA: histone deacetylase [Gemmatimonadaceae bacterium]|jgi:acetoin utilization deacetylase AcuC-like enzyme